MNITAFFAVGRAITSAGEGGRLLEAGVEFEAVAVPVMTGSKIADVVRSLPAMSASQRKSLRAGCHAVIDLVFDCQDNPKSATPVANGLADLFPAKP